MNPKIVAAAALLGCAVAAGNANAIMLLPRFPTPQSNSPQPGTPNNGNAPGTPGSPTGSGDPQGSPGNGNQPQTWPVGDLTLVEQSGPTTSNVQTPQPRALPEPGTWALLAAVVAGIAVSSRRSKTR